MRSLLLWLILLNVSLGGTIDPNVPDSKYVNYGNTYECIVSLGGKINREGDENNNKTFFASGVLIQPKIVLTAAHVMKQAKDCYIKHKENNVDILYSVVYDKFTEEKFGFDIAVCLLKEDVKISVYPELYDAEDEMGKICGIVGYGRTGIYTTGATKYDHLKRGGSNIIDSILADLLVCSVKSGTKTQLEFLIASGDSGGGLFIDKKLAGINSGIMTGDKKLDSNINDESLHTRISVHKKWIQEAIEILEKLK